MRGYFSALSLASLDLHKELHLGPELLALVLHAELQQADGLVLSNLQAGIVQKEVDELQICTKCQ